MNLLRKILLAFFKLLGAFVVLMAVIVIAGTYLNHRAEQRAAGFCESVADGARLSELTAKAERMAVKHYQNRFAEQHHFMFPGMVFNWSDCIVATRDGAVVRKWITPAQD